MIFLIYKKEIVTDIKSKLMVTMVEKWPRVNWEIGIGIYILLCLLLGKKVMTNLDSMLKSRDITLPTKIRLVTGFSSGHIWM